MKKYNTSDSFTDLERDIVVGSALGDGNIQRNAGKNGTARMRFMQGIAQLEYLQWKESIMSRWVGTGITGPEETEYGGLIYSFTTLCHPLFLEIGTKIRDKRKYFFPTHELTMRAAAIWFMDDGSSHGNYSSISMCRFHETEVIKARDWFLENGIECRIYITSRGPILYFTSKGTAVLREKFAPYIHPALEYKMTGLSVQKIKWTKETAPQLLSPIKKCKICGKEFRPKGSHVTCSKACQEENMRRYQISYQQRKKIMSIV